MRREMEPIEALRRRVEVLEDMYLATRTRVTTLESVVLQLQLWSGAYQHPNGSGGGGVLDVTQTIRNVQKFDMLRAGTPQQPPTIIAG
jgi:hypothetical protein